MAVRAEPVAPSWRDGRVTSWLTTVDHKRIGILYGVTAFVFRMSCSSSELAAAIFAHMRAHDAVWFATGKLGDAP